MIGRMLDVATSLGATVVRGGTGMAVGPLGPRPEARLRLYEFEGCPFCRKVREALSILDLDAEIYPCPKGGPRYREEVKKRGGKYQFPYLIDSSTGDEMYESDDIVRHLFDRYGAGSPPWALALGPLTDLSAGIATALRPASGIRYVPARVPELPLELYSFEASPFCRIVREKLCSLELPYLLHNVAKGSPKRDAFVRRSGKMMVPYLVDPNTDTAMFESTDIVDYLSATYAVGGS